MAVSKIVNRKKKFKFHGTFDSKQKAESLESKIKDSFIIPTKANKFSVVTLLNRK